MWTDRDKDRFYDAVKEAVMSGARPDEMLGELEQGYYMALDDQKKVAMYEFSQRLKR